MSQFTIGQQTKAIPYSEVILMFLHGKMIYIGNSDIKEQDKDEEEEKQRGT